MKHEGIIVIGTPRSGTTLLRRLLDAHPNIACPGETYLFSACARFLESDRIAENVDLGVLTGLSYAGFQEAEVLDRLREFAFAFHREHARRKGKSRWVEKTAMDSFHLAAIEKLCGDYVHFICIIRHGLDVVLSIQEACGKNQCYLRELHEYVKRYPRPLVAFAHVWADLTTAICAFAERHPKDAVMLRYEDLVVEPNGEMARILEFVGEQWEPSILDAAMQKKEGVGVGDWKTYTKTRIDTSSVGRWKKLSRSTISELGKIVNPTLKACGYDTVDVEGQRRGDEARRRYELGLLINAMKPAR